MAGKLRLKAEYQKSRGSTSWSVGEAIIIRLWAAFWLLFLRWTPKWMNRFRLLSLRMFGAKIHGRPFVFSSAKIYAPFNLELDDRACLGPCINVYCLGRVILGSRAVVSQESMICGGTHDLSSPRMPLLIGDINLGADAFVGARALILPGVTIGEGAVVGAGAVVTKDVEPWTVVGGNPAKFIKDRLLSDAVNG